MFSDSNQIPSAFGDNKLDKQRKPQNIAIIIIMSVFLCFITRIDIGLCGKMYINE